MNGQAQVVPPAPPPLPRTRPSDQPRKDERHGRHKGDTRGHVKIQEDKRNPSKDRHPDDKRPLHKDGQEEDKRPRERSDPGPKPKPKVELHGLSYLRRDTPFICNIRFRNDLPEIPSDPKMLVDPFQPQRLASFFLTSMETQLPRELLLPPDLGIPITLMDGDRYTIPEDAPTTLAPEDAALLGDTQETKNRAPETNWLMRTTYITAESENKRAKKAKASGLVSQLSTDLDQQIDLIEASFEAARAPPVHHQNQDLVPVEVLPVLPDFECWMNKYVTVQYENDPVEEFGDVGGDKSLEVKRKMAERSMLKTFKVDSEQQGQSTFLALMVPRDPPLEDLRNEEGDVLASELEGEYVWVKEFAYPQTRSMDEGDAFLLRFREGVATYCDLSNRLAVKKRKRPLDFNRPSRVTVTRRDYNANEEQQRRARQMALYGDEDEEE